MGISENVYIDRKALELIEKFLDYMLVEDDSTLRARLGEIDGVIKFAKLLKEGDNKDDER